MAHSSDDQELDGNPRYQVMPNLEPWEFEALKESIRQYGVILPVVRDEHGRTIDGHQRERACRDLGIDDYPVLTLAGLDDAQKRDHAHLLNLIRRNVTRQQMRALIAAELRRFPDLPSRWLAKIVGVCDKTVESVRQELIATAGIPQFDRLKGRHFPSRPSIQIMTMTAREAERAQEAIRMVSEAATREPERHGKLVDRMNKSGPFNGVVRDLRIAEEAQKIRCEPQPLPTGPFRVAVVVPPWMYDAKCSPSRRAVTNYPVMTAEQIKAVEVPSIMEVDSVVWLWITNQHLAECAGAEILRHWGYRPVSLLTWDQDRIGTGIWLRGQTEHAILGVRGEISPPQQPESTLLRASRPKGHSTKPDEFYLMVERTFPGLKSEIFAPTERPGWTCWGSELWGDLEACEASPRRRVARDASAAGVVVEV